MNSTRTKGFTIIEVVLVLAIAGLIFLMVFIALPTLQRNQRDTQRRDDLARIKAQVNQYQANSKGAVPSDSTAGCAIVAGNAGDFISRYLETGGVATTFVDPSGNAYRSASCIAPVNPMPANAPVGQWFFNRDATCGATEGSTAAGGARDYAIMMKLEGSGISCLDNKN
ncbi:MAG: type II secretion system protein [Candidatus Saccharimonadales bacterium]